MADVFRVRLLCIGASSTTTVTTGNAGPTSRGVLRLGRIVVVDEELALLAVAPRLGPGHVHDVEYALCTAHVVEDLVHFLQRATRLRGLDMSVMKG
jgi:hypothetical protein